MAEITEAIAKIAPPYPIRSVRESEQAKWLRFTRTCYKHLAGELGVAFTTALVQKRYFQEREESYQLTPSGSQCLDKFGVKTNHTEPIPRHVD